MPATRVSFALATLLLVLCGVGLRAPYLGWLQDAVWEHNYSLTGAEHRHVDTAVRFDTKRKEYVVGFASHTWMVKELLERAGDRELGRSELVLIARTVSLVYGALTIGLLAVVAWWLSGSVLTALLAAAFLATAPLAILYSALGTADAAVTFYFLLCTFLAYLYRERDSDLLFTLSMVALGACLAVKFFVSALAIPMLVLLLDRNGLSRATTAALVIVAGFALASLFNFPPWDMIRFGALLLYDNVQTVEGASLVGSSVAYLHMLVPALGIGCALFLAVGLGGAALRTVRAVRAGPWREIRGLRALGDRAAGLLRDPLAMLVVPFALQLFMVINLGVYPARHILFLVPFLCYAAALGLTAVLARLAGRPLLVGLGIALLFAYQVYNSHGLATLYAADIRLDLKSWIAQNVKPSESIGSFRYYSGVSGVERLTNENLTDPSLQPDYVATCKPEYGRYLGKDDATQVYHAYGGQDRLEFMNDLIDGRSTYRQVARFDRRSYTVEQKLIDGGMLGDIDIRVPATCLVFRRP